MSKPRRRSSRRRCREPPHLAVPHRRVSMSSDQDTDWALNVIAVLAHAVQELVLTVGRPVIALLRYILWEAWTTRQQGPNSRKGGA